MAYMNQEKKAKIAPKVKAICKKYGVKASLAVRHHSTLVLNIKSSKIDFIGNYMEMAAKRADPSATWNTNKESTNLDVNPYWYHEHFSGKALKFFSELFPAMNAGNHDNSDIQTDYFDVGFYVSVHVGQWNKPYILEK